MAAEDLVRSHPFAFKKDSTLGPASITTATSLAVHSAERGEGCAIIILPGPHNPFEGGGREHMGSPTNTLAVGIQPATL